MLYGPEKARDIARSILPSTRRRSAREDAARLKRNTRRHNRQSLHTWARYDDPYDYEGHIYDYDEPSPCHAYWGTIKDVMWDRRNGDKLGAFQRWAPAVTKHLPNGEARYMAVKKVLPDNLIGRHALSHIEHLEEFEHGDQFKYGLSRYYRTNRADRPVNPWRNPDHIAHLLRELIANGYHRELNRVHYVAGLHTIEADAQVIAHSPPDWPAKVAFQRLVTDLHIR